MFGDENIIELKVDDSNIKRAGWHLPSSIFYMEDIDCMPSLGMVTLNALSAADSVIIPVQAQYLPAKGMTQLVQTISKVKK